MAKRTGLMKKNGKLDIDTIEEKVALGAPPGASVNSLVSLCARKENTAELTAVHLFVCFYQNDIHYYKRFNV